MIPDSTQSPHMSPTHEPAEDPALAGYKECAVEAMKWLAGLGYEPGHPLMKSLAAHLTRRQAYLEKIDLERFLVNEALGRAPDQSANSNNDDNVDFQIDIDIIGNDKEDDADADPDEDEDDREFNRKLEEIRAEANIQTALIEAVFRGCDLRYQH